MSNEIFDRETKLDLLVNVIPLFILGFFIVGFLVFAPFGIDPLASSIQFGLIAIPFVLLAVLTYFAAVAVAGSEKSGPVYLPGQASVSGAEPLEVPGEEDEVSEDVAAELDDDADGETEESEADAVDADEAATDAEDDERDGSDADDEAEPDAEDPEAEPDAEDAEDAEAEPDSERNS
jgi:hypothetical protein